MEVSHMADDIESELRTALKDLRNNTAAEVDVEHGLADLHKRVRVRRGLTRRSGLALVAAAVVVVMVGLLAVLLGGGPTDVVAVGDQARSESPRVNDPEA